MAHPKPPTHGYQGAEETAAAIGGLIGVHDQTPRPGRDDAVPEEGNNVNESEAPEPEVESAENIMDELPSKPPTVI